MQWMHCEDLLTVLTEFLQFRVVFENKQNKQTKRSDADKTSLKPGKANPSPALWVYVNYLSHSSAAGGASAGRV